MNHSVHGTVLAAFLAAALPAQRTLIVDASGAPDADFTDLPAALAAVQEGDTYLVRSGTYQGTSVTTWVSFRLVGQGRPSVLPAGSGPTLELTLIGTPDQDVAISGLDITSTGSGQWALRARAYGVFPSPTLHVEDCTISSQSPLMDRFALGVSGLGLTASRCTLGPSRVDSCPAVFSECSLVGADATQSGGFTNFPQAALEVMNADVWVIDSDLTAGSCLGQARTPASCVFVGDSFSGSPSHLRLCGSSVLLGDQRPSAAFTAPDLVRCYATWNPNLPTVDHEPGVTLTPSPLGALFTAGMHTSSRVIPHLIVGPATLGAVHHSTVRGPAGHLAACLVGIATNPVELLGAPVLLDLGQAVSLGLVTLPAGGTADFPLPVPADPLLTGLTLHGTAVVVDPGTGALSITQPAAAMLR